MNDVTLKVGFDIDKFTSELKKTNSALDSWATGLKGIAGTIGLAFGIKEVASFGLEVSKLAGEAEGVSAAFNKLPQSIKLMMDLKQATGNTVSELDLMKRSVQAANFGISLSALPKLLEFATIRAQQTGQSVDYLVDSIVTGIGRKSPLILDNLGISAVALKEKLGDVSIGAATVGDVAEAVGKIAGESLKTMGSLSDNTSTKIQKLAGSWENVKVAIGDAANGTGILGTGIDALTATFDIFASKNLTFFEKLGAMFSPGGVGLAIGKDYAENLKKAEEEQKKLDSVVKQASQAIDTFGFNLDAISKAYKQNINFTEIYNEVLKRQKEETEKVAKAMELQAQAARKIAEEQAKIFKPSTNYNFGLSQQSNTSGVQLQSTDSMPNKVGGVDLESYFKQSEAALVKSKELRDELKGVQIDISNSTANFVADLAYTIGQSITGTVNFGQAILKAISNFMKSLGDQLIALGFARIAFEYLWENPYAAIAAGIALEIAAGAVSSSAASSISSLTSGGGGGGSGVGSSRYSGNQRANDIYNTQITFKLRGQDLYGSLQAVTANNHITLGP